MKKILAALLTPVIFWSASVSFAQTATDISTTSAIKDLLSRQSSALLFPQSVGRFYQRTNFTPVWINRLKQQQPTWEAMLLLDCVLQYGLSHTDYHPAELSYPVLQAIQENSAAVSAAQKARVEVMLTDALIALMNHLHYGKLNPVYNAARLDRGMDVPFRAELQLAQIISAGSLITAIEQVQPRSKAYTALQYWMHAWKGQYTGDCYQVPETDVRRVAINMERLRWANINDSSTYLQLNIPSLQLLYHRPDHDLTYRVVINDTFKVVPSLNARMSYFLSPSKTYAGSGIAAAAIPPANRLVFRLANRPDVYFYDALYAGDEISGAKQAGIGIQHASSLATMLLRDDGQFEAARQLNHYISKHKRHEFIFRHPVPVKITYITCAIADGELITYDDKYQLDEKQELILYDSPEASLPVKR